jgi:calcineurin-like phosphoesterase family protein
MSTITWLHISDLHWREAQAYDANVVTNALLRDLADRTQIAPELAQIDMIFVTGDVAFAGQPEEYRLAQRFFDDLLRVTKVDKSRLFIVPGNHDVDRTAIAETAINLVAGLVSRQLVNQVLADEVSRATIMQRLHRYQRFANSYLKRHLPFDSARYCYVKKRRLGSKEIAILGFNTAWTAGSNADYARLLLGERQVRSALDQAKHADIRIALLHHPFEWLRDFDRDDCESLLLRECDLVLHGHVHRTGIMKLEAPGSTALVIGAGACYDTRDYPNACNLVHLDFVSGHGTVYLRMYSDHQGGFWTKDLLTYQDAPGKYTFDLPQHWIKIPSMSQPAYDGVALSHLGRNEPDVTHGQAGLVQWWKGRGYKSNPFEYSNAADVNEPIFSEICQMWHIDPNSRTDPNGLGPTPTLDKVKSKETSQLVLIYAPAGGGKTFYRRWAAQQIKEEVQQDEKNGHLDCTLEITNLAEHIPDPGNVTAFDLAVCIYQNVCEKFSAQKPPLVGTNVLHILKQCDQIIAGFVVARTTRRVYVFIEDVDQLFDERLSEAAQNTQALRALVDFCQIAAGRGGGEPLALRIFVPEQLRKSIQKDFGRRGHQRIDECTISWNVEHCQAIIERRLDSCWSFGPNTGVIHIERLLTSDASDEFRKWLQGQKSISPRCSIQIVGRLVDFAYSQGVTKEDRITVETWKKFAELEETSIPCGPDAAYSLLQSRRKLPNWLWPTFLLITILFGGVYVAVSVPGSFETTFFGLVHWVGDAIAWLAAASDWLEGSILLAVVIGSALFILWCMKTNSRSSQQPDFGSCLRRAWLFIRRHLPGGR